MKRTALRVFPKFRMLLLVVLLLAVLVPVELGSQESGGEDSTEACCLPDGDCADLSPGSCLDQGGKPQGEGTTCSDATLTCPKPTQACCFADGTCDDLTPSSCADQGGEPQGEETTCHNTSCAPATQACCLPSGRCRDLDINGCQDEGGTPQGEGTRCSQASCAKPTRPCCFPDGRCEDLAMDLCRERGGTPRGTSSVCARTSCPQPKCPPAEIGLLGPLPGEGLDPADPSVSLCWEALGVAGVEYEVIHRSKQCDPDVLNAPHPFAPLIPDPQLVRRRDEHRLEERNLETQIGALLEYCEGLDTFFEQVEQRLDEIPNELRRLERGRDEADAAQVDTEEAPFELPLPSSCPQAASENLAPFAGALDRLEVPPCEAGPCRALSETLRGLTARVQSLQANAVVQRLEFERLKERWVNGADHRGTMELYHGLFSFVDGAISLVTDLIDVLTPDLEAEIQELIEETLTDAVCRQNPDLCEAIETAQTVREKLDAIRSILRSARSTGTPGPAFIVQMVQAMAQQAAAATAVAVEGWANFAEVMSAVLWDAYEALLCEQQALEWLRDQRAHIEATCNACLACLQQTLEQIQDAIDDVDAEIEAASQERAAYWQEQRAAISASISRLGEALEDDWYDACCENAPARISVPGESLCSQQLEAALKDVLGDRACFLTFECTLECEFDGAELIGARVSCEHSFPLSERRACCCVPCQYESTSLGSAPDPGGVGTPVCLPPGATSGAPGTWEVQARDEDGRLVGESPRRLLGSGGITEPREIPTTRPGCDCAISGSLDGASVSPGALILAPSNVPVVISAGGGCGAPCAAGTTSITVQPPAPAPTWLGIPLVFAPPPFSVAGSTATYSFPFPGRYRVTLTRLCEDGSECSAEFDVLASVPPSPVLRHPDTGGSSSTCCPSCGAEPCLRLSYQVDREPPFTPVAGHRLSLLSPMPLDLSLESTCAPDCDAPRFIRWEFTSPSGEMKSLEGEALYDVTVLVEEGETLLCAIETMKCSEIEHRFENWWIFSVDP